MAVIIGYRKGTEDMITTSQKVRNAVATMNGGAFTIKDVLKKCDGANSKSVYSSLNYMISKGEVEKLQTRSPSNSTYLKTTSKGEMRISNSSQPITETVRNLIKTLQGQVFTVRDLRSRFKNVSRRSIKDTLNYLVRTGELKKLPKQTDNFWETASYQVNDIPPLSSPSKKTVVESISERLRGIASEIDSGIEIEIDLSDISDEDLLDELARRMGKE